MKLVKVIYLGRHGEREPLHVPSSFAKDWKRAGALTPKGEESQYKRGQYLHEKYKDFLPVARILCLSSYLDRTIDSGFCLLSGLLGLPFTSPQTINKEEKIAFLGKYGAKIRPWNADAIYCSHMSCVSPLTDTLRYGQLKLAFDKKEHFDKLMPIIPIATKVLEKKLDAPMDYHGIFALYDLLECYRANGKEFPKGFEDGKLHKELAFIHHYILYNLRFESEVMRRLANHFIFKQFISIITENPEPTFYYYSSHDINIYAIILGLGYDVKEAPPHSSGLVIEIYQSPEGQFANFIYKEESLNKKIFPSLKDEYIPLEHLLEKLKNECFKDDEEFRKYSGNKDFDYIRDYVNSKPIIEVTKS